jgi:hypothetical protein
MSNLFSTNQVQQQPACGDLDLSLFQTGALAGIVSANQSGAIKAGTAAKIDTTITSGSVIQFLACAYTDVAAIGFFRRTSKAATFNIGDDCEVVVPPMPIMWLLASGTITPGGAVQNYTDSFGVVALSGGKQRGYNLQYAVSGQLTRILLSVPFAVVS